ncbi:MAG TPA: hypothetical protein VLH10_07860 [Yinghuangia sp.]|uniref:hypothetical protein n=1 Tax=Yinghuangia sp. YIM S10712 TaxID=3436930 RepID=UPI002C7F00E3|nr:hypothetical protein [Yinghuangia sp.]
MRYFVHVECVPPPRTAPFDVLQRAGVVHVLDDSLARLEAIDGPDGMVIGVGERWVAAHPAGANLVLTLYAPALEFAEGAARLAVEGLLDAAEELDRRSVTSCEVKLHDELAHESLVAADGPDAPPSDPDERRRRMRPEPRDADEAESAEDDAEAVAPASRLRALAGRLGCGLDAFGFSPAEDSDAAREDAELAAGAVVAAVDQLTDELFFDLVQLSRDENAASAADVAGLLAVGLLPEEFADQYTPAFVRRFILTTASVVERLMSSSRLGLASVAEELALRLLLDDAVGILEMHDLHEETELALDTFKTTVYDTDNHDRLYRADAADEHVDVMEWFTPFKPTAYAHPYTVDRGI